MIGLNTMQTDNHGSALITIPKCGKLSLVLLQIEHSLILISQKQMYLGINTSVFFWPEEVQQLFFQHTIHNTILKASIYIEHQVRLSRQRPRWPTTSRTRQASD